jgi:electron transfer flavoprotein beta subunit
MKIVVCVKQVPDTVELTIDKETGVLVRENVPAILNPFDAYAIEEGVLIKDSCGGDVTAITMGPLQALAVLHEAFSVGVDHAVHICDSAFRGSDTFVTAKILATAIKKLGGVDLILCGKQAIDGDTAQVGPEIAEFLGIPHVAYVKKIREVGKDAIVLERMTETGVEVIRVKLPALLTVLKDINTPRLPSFKLKRAAKEKVIPTWGLAELNLSENEVGLLGSPTTVMKTFTPKARGKCKMLSGSNEEIITALFSEIESAI